MILYTRYAFGAPVPRGMSVTTPAPTTDPGHASHPDRLGGLRDAAVRRPRATAVLLAAIGLGSLWLGGRIMGNPGPYAPASVAGYLLPLGVTAVLLWLVGRPEDLRPSACGLGQVVTRGWPALAAATVVAVLGQVGGGPTGRTVPVSLVWFLMVTVCTAVLEEALCRGTIQSVLAASGMTTRRAVLWAAGVFSIMHAANLLTAPGQVVSTIAQVGCTFCLGVLLGTIYARCGNLWVTVIIHFVFNLLGDLSTLTHGEPVGGVPDIPVGGLLLLWLLGLPMLVAGLVMLSRDRRAVAVEA